MLKGWWRNLFGLGGKLAPADRTARAIAGAGLIVAGVVVGVVAAPWVTVLVIAVGAFLVGEAALNYCPAATVWPWNRARSEKGLAGLLTQVPRRPGTAPGRSGQATRAAPARSATCALQ